MFLISLLGILCFKTQSGCAMQCLACANVYYYVSIIIADVVMNVSKEQSPDLLFFENIGHFSLTVLTHDYLFHEVALGGSLFSPHYLSHHSKYSADPAKVFMTYLIFLPYLAL